ncbi:hypothetical protein GWR56_06405 [Mucilaginibacter sp. 14171R-50]|uniref:hypothetical protein n=1 Tax=Mucilaginibacter sp. 14171R-50 TaxID=2703789 RepID=UPI00138DB9FE|nr:hypothetical protein [Mucilaginibacter sp. 14171R-50]QHS55187.1 hypothetical protein GWR56_06405 [Mucilaginibacter sp. 14171R-50]
MRNLSQICAAALLVVTSAFTTVNENLFPELALSFKELKKTKIAQDRQDALTSVEQVGIVAKQQKKAVVFELLGTDGQTAPLAKAVLIAALAGNGVTDAKVVCVGPVATDKVVPALAGMGFKVSGTDARFNDTASPVSLQAQASDPAAVHVLLNDDAASLMAAPDKFAVKLHYPANADAKLVASEMLYAAAQIKYYWKN